MSKSIKFYKVRAKSGGKDEFSTFDLMRILDIKRERLREWMNQGFIEPTSASPVRGSPASFSRLDLYKTAVFKSLVETGMNRTKTAAWIKKNPDLNQLDRILNIDLILVVVRSENPDDWIALLNPDCPFQKDVQPDFVDWRSGLMINYKAIRNAIEERVSGT